MSANATDLSPHQFYRNIENILREISVCERQAQRVALLQPYVGAIAMERDKFAVLLLDLAEHLQRNKLQIGHLADADYRRKARQNAAQKGR